MCRKRWDTCRSKCQCGASEGQAEGSVVALAGSAAEASTQSGKKTLLEIPISFSTLMTDLPFKERPVWEASWDWGWETGSEHGLQKLLDGQRGWRRGKRQSFGEMVNLCWPARYLLYDDIYEPVWKNLDLEIDSCNHQTRKSAHYVMFTFVFRAVQQ